MFYFIFHSLERHRKRDIFIAQTMDGQRILCHLMFFLFSILLLFFFYSLHSSIHSAHHHPHMHTFCLLPLLSSLHSLFLFSRRRTAGRAGTLRPCRCPPASDGRRAGWLVAGHGGSWRRWGRSRPRSCRPPSGCGRRRWWRSCHSRCRSPNSCRLVRRKKTQRC